MPEQVPGALQLPLTKKAQDRWLRREVILPEKANFAQYHVMGNKVSSDLFKVLSKQLRMDRSLIAGSIGKRTWLGVSEAPDFDLVILLNRTKSGDLPDPVQVIDTIADVIGKLGKPFKVVRKTKHVVGVVYESPELGKIDFDVVPGLNFYKNPTDGPNHAQSQLDGTLEYICKHHGNNYSKKPFLSASLAEAVVDFVIVQDEFTHDVIKLAKRWNKKQINENKIGKIYGRSFTMELLAIHAATKETDEHGKLERTVTGAFELFLNIFLQSKRDVRIVFPCRAKKSLTCVHKQYTDMARSYGVVLDPANPWNNLLAGFNDDQWAQFQGAALRSLEICKRRDPTIIDCFKSPWEPKTDLSQLPADPPTDPPSRCTIL